MRKRAVIKGAGSYLPERIMTNAELESLVETSDAWIRQRTGIVERHIAGEDETTADMATAAASKALSHAGLAPADVDMIIVATTTPDHTFPSVSTMVQAALGVGVCPAFDVQAVCSGFIYGLSIADSMIQTGQAQKILLIGAEKMSSILDWTDRGTCILFGDGAGAVILEASDPVDKADRGILSTHLHADGTLKDILYTDGGPATTKTSGHIIMEGRDVFRHAVQHMADVVDEALTVNNLKAEEIDWLVPHQANIRIIEATAKKLNMPMEQVILTVASHGNTSAASIPLAFAEGVESGRINKGQLILMEALGAGLTWGAALLRY